MANNKIQVKRTTVSGRAPNTTNSSNTQYIATGELALNLTDGILYSSDGTNLITVGANVVNQKVTGTLTINAVSANGGVGTAGQVLTSNGSSTYWSTASGGSSGNPFPSTGKISVGQYAGNTGANAIAIGYRAGNTSQSACAIAIGINAAANTQGTKAIAIGESAGINSQQCYSIAIGAQSATTSQGYAAIAIGYLSGQTNQLVGAVAVGAGAGYNHQAQYTVAVGCNAGSGSQGPQSVAVGAFSGSTCQGRRYYCQALTCGYSSCICGGSAQGYGIAIGYQAGGAYQAGYISITCYHGCYINPCVWTTTYWNAPIAIGRNAGYYQQKNDSIAIGSCSGKNCQQNKAIAIGTYAGQTNQGYNAIAIGWNAGSNNQPNNSIAIGTNVTPSNSGLFISPIRNATGPSSLLYCSTTKEITYGSSSGGATVSDTAPTSPSNGQLWYYSSDAQLYVYYNDGDSSQWVTASGGGGINNANNANYANNASYFGGYAPSTYANTIYVASQLTAYAALSGATFTGNVAINKLLANTQIGTAGFVLTSGGSTGNLYWSQAGGNIDYGLVTGSIAGTTNIDYGAVL